jgi:F-type H+-transporting ATPase subunit b
MLLVDKRRIKHLANIVQEFDTIYYDVTGTQVATVTAASALSEEQLRMIANKLHTITGGHNVKIKSEVNEDLLAGFIVEYGKSGSQCLDLSLRGQLQQMEQSLNASVRELIDKSRGVPVAVQMMVASLGVHAFIADHADAAPGKLFDFDATMPIQMVQFLMLMVFLEKTVFTPIGKIFAERASEIKANRAMGAENNAEIAELNAKAEELLAAARKDANDAVEAAKKEATEKANSTVAAAKASSDQALVTSLADIQKAKEELWAKLEKEVVPVLADDIIAKCAPECVTTAASK